MFEKEAGVNAMDSAETVRPVVKKDKQSTGWKIATGVLGVIALGCAGFLAYHFVSTNHEEKQCEEVTCEVVEVKDEETGETVKVIKVPVGNSDDDVAVRKLVGKMYNIAMEVAYPNYGGGLLTHTYDEVAVLYRPDNLRTATFLDLTYGFALQAGVDRPSYEKLSAMSSALSSALLQNGFKTYEGTMAGQEYINEQTGIVCTVGDGDGTFGCGSVNWYGSVDVDFFNSLADAYKKKEGKYPVYMSANSDKIADSGYEKYQNLTASVENAAGLFYRVSPNSEWVFFQGTQAAIPCSDYDTDDLKRAFVGSSCWNENTNKTDVVKL